MSGMIYLAQELDILYTVASALNVTAPVLVWIETIFGTVYIQYIYTVLISQSILAGAEFGSGSKSISLTFCAL